jgi:ribosome-binding protein aMBF1 (putative translation factor)
MDDCSQRLLASLALLASPKRKRRRPPAAATGRTLRDLVTGLMTARTAAGLTQDQEDVAARIATKKTAISRLESGARTRPTLTTIERYASAV